MAKKKAAPTHAAERLATHHALDLNDLAFALKYLVRYGWLSPEDTMPSAVKDAAERFQGAAGIDTDGVLGQQTLEVMWVPRCGCRDDAYTEAARWRKKDLAYWFDAYLDGVPGLSRGDQQDLMAQALGQYQAAVDVTWRPATSREQADLRIGVGEGRMDGFDGPGGVLAWCELANGADRPITMKFDRSDSWVKNADSGRRGILYLNVAAHEAGHGHGMNHINGPLALLNPIYSPGVSRLQPADLDALYALGYNRASPAQPPSPDPPPAPGQTVIRLEFEKGKAVPDFNVYVSRVGGQQVRVGSYEG